MNEGQNLILATRKYAEEDRGRSWKLLISTVLIFLFFWIGGLVNFHIVPQILCALVGSLVMVRLFIIYHDYLHNSILQNSKLAEAFFTVFGWFILAPISIWRRSHNYHHAHNAKLYTTSIGSFPLVTKQEFLNASKSEQRVYLFIRHPLTIGLGYIFMFIYGFLIRSLRSGGRHIDSLWSILFHIGLGTAITYFLGWQTMLIGFLMPHIISSAIGSYLFYAQHNFPEAKYKERKEDWDYVYAAMHSSSYMKMPKIMHWFTGNIGYHHIHHMNSRIPFYKLPKVFKEMKEMQNVGTTSLAPAEILRCLRIKFWDAANGKMIGLKDVYS